MKYILVIAIVGLVGVAYGTGALPLGAIDTMEDKYETSLLKDEYKLENKILKKEAKDENSIAIEIGNGTDDFSPDFKISRWEDEVWFKMKPQGLDKIKLKDKVLKLDDKIKFETPDVDYHLYDLPISEENPEGAYEYEVILKKKPISNVITFDIETQGLDFWYQPPLTEEFQDGWSEMYEREVTVTETQVKDLDGIVMNDTPENVVGSYAVYHSTKGGFNNSQGKDYKVGKAFHIYRPKIIDSNGWEVWGELFIDKDLGIQTVTIPQSFIDNAVYPIRQAVGEIFGYNTKGSRTTFTVDDELYANSASNVVAAGDGVVDSCHIHGNDSASNFKGVMTGDDEIILADGISPAGTVPTSNGWGDVNYSSKPTVDNGVTYFAWFILSANASAINYDNSGGTLGIDSTNNYDSITNPTDAAYFSVWRYSFYAIYTLTGGAEPAPRPVQEFWVE